MKKIFRTLIGVTLAVLASSGGISCAATRSSAATTVDSFDFAARLLRRNGTEASGSNLCLSPLSLEMAMAMVANGAEGVTRSEILDAMGWEGLSMSQVDRLQQQRLQLLQGNEDVTIALANSLWVNKQAGSVKRSFIKTNKSYFGAEVTRLPFNAAATERINRWCATHTNDKITSILEQVNPAVQMYLINALYFKGTWINRFSTSATRPDAFTLADGSTEQVPMMHQKSYYDYAELADCQLIDMPFISVGEAQYSLYVALPAEGVSADSLLGGLNGQVWNEWKAQLRSQDVRLSLPKFRVEYTSVLNGTLQALGITHAFSAGQADFSGILQKSLCIDMVLQKTYFDVTESGAEAAAVTAIAMMRSSLPAPHEVKVMTVDRPFLFVLAEKKSGSILFIGKVENPKQ
jgi:serpin B